MLLSWAVRYRYQVALRSPPAGRYLNVYKLYLNQLNELRILDDKSDRRNAIELYEKLITTASA
jgi:hypothetical protein